MRALLATDGTSDSLRAATEVRWLLPEHTEWTLLTVVEPVHDPNEDATGFAGPLLTPEEAEQEHAESVVTGFAALARTARALGPFPVHQDEREGDPGHEICRRAEEIGADVIVIGHGRHGAVTHLGLGSVAEHVIAHAPCAVMVVPTDHRPVPS